MKGSRPGPGHILAMPVAAAFVLGLAACSTTPTASPTGFVAAATDSPSPSPLTTPAATVAPSEAPPSPGPTEPSELGIQPGSVDRTSLELTVSYDVKALLSVGSGRLEMATLLRVKNDSGSGIDRLELNTIAAPLGGLRITESTVDDKAVKVQVRDQTLVVPLGGVLPAGGSTAVRIGYRATLQSDLSGSDWLFTRAAGTLALHRWIPWVSRAIPFAHANDGLPFLTQTSTRVDVEIVTDEPMDLATAATEVMEVPAGFGRAWAFSMENVRDLSIVLAPRFDLHKGEAKGIPIRVYVPAGSPDGPGLLSMAADALRTYTEQLGVDYPWPALTVVETQGGEGLETPGLVWVPRAKDPRNRAYALYHTVAHQWFYGLVGSNGQAEPFASEGMADLMARLALGIQRSSSCATSRLDRSISAYSGNCYYEIVQVQGGLVLDQVRQRMGSAKFWAAAKAYLEANRFGIGGTRELLAAFQQASPTPLSGLLRPRFPGLF
jgi:hypothetical protein